MRKQRSYSFWFIFFFYILFWVALVNALWNWSDALRHQPWVPQRLRFGSFSFLQIPGPEQPLAGGSSRGWPQAFGGAVEVPHWWSQGRQNQGITKHIAQRSRKWVWGETTVGKVCLPFLGQSSSDWKKVRGVHGVWWTTVMHCVTRAQQ